MKLRSPRAGWSLVELMGGRWVTVATDDREVLREQFMRLVSAMYDALPRSTLRIEGRAVALFDARGQRRDECPSRPRLLNGTLIEWPAAVPGPEGAETVEKKGRAA